MKYESPQVKLLSSAISAIQSTLMKDLLNNVDGGGVFHTDPAYEADE
jgi:hypothetical protein